MAKVLQKGAPDAKEAILNYRVLETQESDTVSLLKVQIETGRFHQIRAQLAIAGMHIVNDRLYGAFAVENMVGHCLHSLAASFNHPLSGEPCEIRTALPEWWTE